MRTPVVLVTGVDPDAMAAVAIGLQWDLPNAVVVHHRIDVSTQLLHRVVSDASGVLEREEVELEHACVTCAIREDVLPTVERYARDGRWKNVLVHLPVGAEADQVCAVVNRDTRMARHLRVSRVVTALSGEGIVHDLLGDDLLRERDLHSSVDDTRGVGEVACAQVEFADVVVVSDPAPEQGVDLVRTLARPDAAIVVGSERLDAAGLVVGEHRYERAVSWISPTHDDELPPPASDLVWRVELQSPRAFHPERLLERLEELACGEFRSRGCFWLPTRPGRALVWDGSGGQLCIGNGEAWGRRMPFTRLVLTGVGEPPDLGDTFEDLLLGPDLEGRSWSLAEDGFEPWLGDVRNIA